MTSRAFFLVGAGIELGLLGLAEVLAGAFGLPLWRQFHWQPGALISGAGVALAMWAGFKRFLDAPPEFLRELRVIFENQLRPMFQGWSIGELLFISVVAGFSEELLFRGAIQTLLQRSLGPGAALVLASLLFGAAHAVNSAYAIIATLIGMILGGLWLGTGNLVGPVTAHGLYDFMALYYWLRVRR